MGDDGRDGRVEVVDVERSSDSLRMMQRVGLSDSQRWFASIHETPTYDYTATHFVLGLIGEAGEVANVVKKIKRGDATWADMLGRLGDEMADVLTYLCDLAAVLGIDLADEWDRKRHFNEERFGGRVGGGRNAG